MLYKAYNKTSNPQQINLIGGSGINVPAGIEVEINEFDIYKDEFERLKLFFKITQVDFKDMPRRITKKFDEPKTDIIEEVD